MNHPKAIVHLDRLARNYKILSNSLNDKRLMAIVKANAYGHGAIECSKTLEGQGCDSFSVFTIEEAKELRNAGLKSDILLLSKLEKESIQTAIDNDLIVNISSIDDLDSIILFLEKNGLSPRFHMKIETGMNRLGFDLSDISLAIGKLLNYKNLNCEGIYTHYATSDEGDLSYAHLQQERFEKALEIANEMGYTFKYKHISNSGGLLSELSSNTNMLRIGILLYGIYPSKHVEKKYVLEPVLEFKAPIVDYRNAKKGATVSYGGLYTTKKDTIIGIIQCGFADGFPRPWFEKGYVSYNGKSFKIAGRVCMDQFMVDFENEIPKIGDEVLIYGSDGKDCISVETISNAINTSPYTITTALKKRTNWVFKK